jgi:hypothetical protein
MQLSHTHAALTVQLREVTGLRMCALELASDTLQAALPAHKEGKGESNGDG